MVPAAGLGVGVGVGLDGRLCQSEVLAASHGPAGRTHSEVHGEHAVVVLVGLRLGLSLRDD
jgi:hypothetical protein